MQCEFNTSSIGTVALGANKNDLTICNIFFLFRLVMIAQEPIIQETEQNNCKYTAMWLRAQNKGSLFNNINFRLNIIYC